MIKSCAPQGLLEKVDNNTSKLTVQDTITNVRWLEVVLEDMRSSKKRRDARKEHIPRVADFGDQTWPRDPVMAVNASFPELRPVLVELAWRSVDHVAVQVQGKTACMISVPMLEPLPGLTSPEYSTHGRSAAPGAAYLPLRLGSVRGLTDTRRNEYYHHELAP
ncbi:MAG: hypothetical protein ACKPKO_01290, partial [Candidatus Fonsibacter sp.]